MPFDPQAVEIFTSDLTPYIKYCLCVGYAIDAQLYCMRKFGAIHPAYDLIEREQARVIEAARRTYDRIPDMGELTYPVFAYDFGVPCDDDDDGEPIGDWPQIGTLTLRYTKKFLMPGGKLPQGQQHLVPFRTYQVSWPR
jgi:hypothetical protein